MSRQVVIQSFPNPPIPHSSPYHASYSAFAIFRTDDPLAKDKRKEHADSNANMGCHLEIDDFIAAFTPISVASSKGKPYQMPKSITQMITRARSERKVAEAWAKWLNPVKEGAKAPCPGYRLALSQDLWDTGDAEKLKVDGALHCQNELPGDGRPHWESQRVLFEFKRGGGALDPYDDNKRGDADSASRVDVRGQVTSYAAHAFARQHRTAMFLFLINGKNMRATRWDRSGTVFSAAFNYVQERDTLRKLLWGFSRLNEKKQGIDDTAVLLISTDSDYIAMSNAAKNNKNDISEVEGTVVKGEGPWTFRFVRELFAKSIANGTPRYRLSVPGTEGQKDFLVGDPIFIAPGMSGRGTRCYVAYDRPGKRFVFLKDAWRPPSENVQTEGNVLRQLHDTNVRNVPTIVCDGELDQETETPLYVPSPDDDSSQSSASATDSVADQTTGEQVDDVDMDGGEENPGWSPAGASRCSSPSPDKTSPLQEETQPPPQGPTPSAFHNRGQHLVRTFRHYRLIVEEVCLELHTFRSGKQLMTIIRDAVRAHSDAVNKAGILHRDVSAGNILICPTVILDPTDNKRRVVWKGMLTDWELSKPLPKDGDQPSARQPIRTGTWQYTSAWILDNPEDAVLTADELESFFHVSYYMGLRYMRHCCSNLPMTMFDYFDSYKYDPEKERYLCGADKYFAMQNGELKDATKKRPWFLDDKGEKEQHPIDAIFTTVLGWLKQRYDVMTSTKPTKDPLPLDDHTALLELLDSKLDDPQPGQTATAWPVKDKVGDQLKPAKKHESDGDEKPRAKRVKTNESAKGGARGEAGSARASGSSNAVTRAPPARTRGNRLKRGVGSSRSKLTR